MRRSGLFAASVLILVPVLSWGQRGGGFHSGGGFHGGGGFRAGGGFHAGGGFASRGGMRAGSASFARAPRSSFRSANGFHSGRGPFFGDGRRFRHDRGFRFATYPFGTYPYYWYPYYGWYGDPFWGDWGNSSYDSRDNSANANNDVQYQTAAEVNRLADEVEQLREERASSQARAPAPAPQPQKEAKLQEDLPVVIVFLDKHIQEVKNYAVANEMLVALDGKRRVKYPLADIDLAATMKLNDERGVDFQVPNPVVN